MARARNYKDMPADETVTRSVSDPVWRMLTGAFAFTAGVFICGSVGSYAPADPSMNAATIGNAQNLFGVMGAYFADFARQCLGWSAWTAGLAAMIGGAMRAVLIGQPRISRWMTGFLFVPLSAAAFASWPVPASWPLSAGLGGVIGDGLLHIVTIPLQAIFIPYATIIAGLLMSIFAFWAASSALGFGKRDAWLLQSVAARAAMRGWRGLSVMSASLVDRVRTRHDRSDGRIIPDEGRDYAPATSAYDDDYSEDAPQQIVAQRTIQTENEHSSDAPEPSAIRQKLFAPRTRVHKGGRTSNAALPPIDLLQTPPVRSGAVDEEALLAQAARLAEVLKEFGVQGRIIEVRPGPVVTLFELEPAPGVKSARVIGLADDIARSMSATSARIAVIPGKNAIGVELPNTKRETVFFRSLLSSDAYRNSKAVLPMALGEDIGGTPTVVELAKMPHLLIAGTTGSGKSVGVNAMILSLMYKLTPEQCRFIMIDPKMLELSIYEGIPHLLSPVVTDPKKAVNALKWTVREMESRYELMSKANVRNLAGFNAKAKEYREKGEMLTRKVQTGYDDAGKAKYETEALPIDAIPNIVVVIDEMADLMMVAGKEIEGCIQRLAQMARAAGIHLITATQRPSVDVITGTIKANFPTRISYMVTTKIDSRTILGEQGAEQLLGMGDLLYQAPGGKTKRLHGPFVSDEEVETVVGWLKQTGEPNYQTDILEDPEEGDGSAVMDAMLGTSTGSAEEDLYAQGLAIVLRDKRASTSYLQRRLKIGYNRAATLIEQLEEEGIISPPNHAGRREILALKDKGD